MPLFLLGLVWVALAAACAPEWRTTDEVPRSLKRKARSFSVDPSDAELLDAATRAAATWQAALGAPVTVAADGEVPIFRSTLPSGDPGCGPADAARWMAGCSPGLGTPDVRIEVADAAPDGTPASWTYGAVLHEMGHVLRDAGGHLDDPDQPAPSPGYHLMAYGADPAARNARVTPEDAAFVCHSPSTGAIACGSKVP